MVKKKENNSSKCIVCEDTYIHIHIDRAPDKINDKKKESNRDEKRVYVKWKTMNAAKADVAEFQFGMVDFSTRHFLN